MAGNPVTPMDENEPSLEYRTIVLCVALDVVSADLPAGFTKPQLVVVDDVFGTFITVVFDDGWEYGTIPPSAGNEPIAAVCQIAKHVQDSLVQRDRNVWPVCPRHGRGAHPRLDEHGQAQWWCTATGGHTISHIGELRQEEERFVARRRRRPR